MSEIRFAASMGLREYLESQGHDGPRLQRLLDETKLLNGLSGDDPEIGPGAWVTLPEDAFVAGGAPVAPLPVPDPGLDRVGRGSGRRPVRTDGGPTVAGAVGSSKPPPGTPAELRSAVADFEMLGGRGKWFTSTTPERLGGETGGFYVIEALPAEPAPKAEMLLLRTKATLEALRQVVATEKAPVVLCLLPESSQVQAAALGGSKLSTDALTVAGSDKQNIILLTPEAYLPQLAHENRHWLDYEDPSFLPSLTADIESIVSDPGTVGLLKQITLEIRGHIAQAREARDMQQTGLPYLDRAGYLRTGTPSELKIYHDFEQRFARQIFEQAYAPYLFQIFGELDATTREQLLNVLAQYDSTDDPKNAITFRKTLGFKPAAESLGQ